MMNETANHNTVVSGARGRAMTLPGLLLSAAGVAVVLVGLVLTSESLRAGTAEQQTRASMRAVRAALLTYHARHGQMPQPPAHEALAALLADPLVRPIVQTAQLSKDDLGELCIRDGYGRPMRYITRPDEQGVLSADFASVGFDGELGDPASVDQASRRSAIDDVYGADVETTLGGRP